jgi:hypothetical protein
MHYSTDMSVSRPAPLVPCTKIPGEFFGEGRKAERCKPYTRYLRVDGYDEKS